MKTSEAAHRRLYLFMKTARSSGAKAELIADCLRINSKRYTVDNVQEIPAEFHPNKMATSATDAVVLFYGKYSEFSNFYETEFTMEGVKFNNSEQYYQYKKQSFFN